MVPLFYLPLFLLAVSPTVHPTPTAVSGLGALGIPGADPTGLTDSATALNRAIRSLCNATAVPPAVPRDAVLDLNNGVCKDLALT